MAYVDLNTISNPTPGGTILSAWGDQVRENFEATRTPPRLRLTSDFMNIADDTPTDVIFTNEILNFGGMFTGPSDTISPVDGDYLINMAAEWDSNATGRRFLQCNLSGYGSLADVDLPPSTGSKTDFGLAIPLAPIAAGQDLSFIVYQSSGITLQCLVTVSVLWICP